MSPRSSPRSRSSATAPASATPAPETELLGSTLPRLFPQPLVTGAPGECGCGCAHTRETTYGFDADDFARDVLRMPLDPWERWLAIHAGELLPDGRPRFKKLLIIVARQNGKSFLLIVLTLFWLFVERWEYIVGQHTKMAKAREVWEKAYAIASRTPELNAEIGRIWRDNSQLRWEIGGENGGRYVPEAANSDGGRGGSSDRFVVDELRQQKTWEAHSALAPTLNAKPYGQGWWISNQGDARSVVLLKMRKDGITNIEAGNGAEIDPEFGLFEWSAEPGSDMLDPVALCQANPNANRRVSLTSLLADARSAQTNGDLEAIAKFKTEIMCMYVPALDAAVDGTGWALGEQKESLAGARGRLVLVPELAPDQAHASITVAATMPGGKVRVEVLASWAGADAATKLRRALPEWVRKVRPRKVGYLAGGPVEAIVADFDRAKLGGVEIEAIKAELPAVCMGFAEKVAAGEILHSGQELLTKQTLGSAKLWRGAVWVFSRKGEGHCDTTYGAAAGAHLARTLPPSAPLRIVTAPD